MAWASPLHSHPYIVLDKEAGNQLTVVNHSDCNNKPYYREPTELELQQMPETIRGYDVMPLEGKNVITISIGEPIDREGLFKYLLQSFQEMESVAIGPYLTVTKDEFQKNSDATLEKIAKKFKEKGKMDAFKLLVHESFHHIDQEDQWHMNTSLSNRFSTSTEPGCTPRKYRGFINYYLQQALKSNSTERTQDALSKAAYWNRKYQEEFPKNASISTILDNTEGGAVFVAQMAMAIVATGCEAPIHELREAFQKDFF